MQEREAVFRGPRRAAPERTPREARDMPLQRHVPLAGNTACAEWSEPPAVNPSSRSREDRCRVSEPGWGPEHTPDCIRGRASGVLGPRGWPRSGGDTSRLRVRPLRSRPRARREQLGAVSKAIRAAHGACLLRGIDGPSRSATYSLGLRVSEELALHPLVAIDES